MEGSSDSNSLSFEHLESTVIVIPFVAIIVDITVVRIVVHVSHVILVIAVVFLVSGLRIIVASFEVAPKSGIFIECDGFEFAVGIEAEDHEEDVVGEADDGVCVDELVDACVGGWVCAVLDGGEEEDHEGDCEEDADEDEEHHELVAALVLDHPDDEDEEKAEECLLQELFGCDEVQDDNDELHQHDHLQGLFEEHPLFCRRNHLGTTTHLNAIFDTYKEKLTISEICRPAPDKHPVHLPQALQQHKETVPPSALAHAFDLCSILRLLPKDRLYRLNCSRK